MSVNHISLKSEKGMTLMEMIIVVVILSLIASALVLTVGRQFGKAQPKTAQLAISQIEGGLVLYLADMGNYPDESAGLEALVQDPGDSVMWQGPYIKKVPNDPWENPYVYRIPSQHGLDYDLCSNGKDETEGTEDDICNWK